MSTLVFSSLPGSVPLKPRNLAWRRNNKTFWNSWFHLQSSLQCPAVCILTTDCFYQAGMAPVQRNKPSISPLAWRSAAQWVSCTLRNTVKQSANSFTECQKQIKSINNNTNHLIPQRYSFPCHVGWHIGTSDTPSCCACEGFEQSSFAGSRLWSLWAGS